MATQFENGLTLSELAERNAELVTEVEKLRAERDASLNAERVWEKTMMEVCGEDGPVSVASEIRSLQALRDTAMQALKSQVEQLAAENVQIKAMNDCLSEELRGYESDGAFEGPKMHLLWWQVETPATDAYLAGIKADAIDEAAVELDRVDTVASTRVIGFKLREFSQQLREGAK
ncbi:TPA: hypothetical protein ACVFEZ_004870 [Klebsiella pneumoniae]